MKIIEPKAELFEFVDSEFIMKKLEQCGRVSHQSEPRENSAENFVRMLIKRGHESVLEHVSLTFHIICDRGVMAELTRHRHASFTVESTRYVNYKELEVIPPSWAEDSLEYREWYSLARQVEDTYCKWIERGIRPEEARTVLQNCLKSEMYVTANLREWRYICKLRTDKAAHPQMRQVANQILDILRDKLPIIVEDIRNE